MVSSHRLGAAGVSGHHSDIIHAAGLNPQQDTPRLHFKITPPGMYTQFHHNVPIPFINWGLVGWSLWLNFPSTRENMEAWYSSKKTDRFQTFQWATANLSGLVTCIVGPGQRAIFYPAYFHACISLTPAIQASLEFVTHDELPNILYLQKQGLDLMDLVPDGHQYANFDNYRHSWTQALDDRFFKHFRSLWRVQWDAAIEEMENLKEAEDSKGESSGEDDAAGAFSFDGDDL